jgi:phosphatidylinositol alpha-mannosyltransferase
MRLALVSPYSLSVPGGVQLQVLDLARAIRALGHDVTVMGPADDFVTEQGVVVLGRSVSVTANGSVAPVGLGPRCLATTARQIRLGSFDLVHVHEPLVPGPGLVALLVANSPVVGTFHRSGKSLAYSLGRPLLRRVASRLRARFAVSPDAAATAREVTGGDYSIVPNGIVIERYSAVPPWPKDGPTIVFVGRHEPRKGLDVLLQAYARLRPPARLWVLGTGPETATLRRRYEDLSSVEWVGTVGEAEKAARLRAADVVCVPSLYGESFGVVLLEAMAAGTALVATDLPAYRRVVSDGKDALLVPPGDPEALARALDRLIRDHHLAEQLISGAKETVAQYSMDRVAAAYMEHYAKVLEATRPTL